MANKEIGYLFLISIPLVAGLSTIEGIKIAGFSYTGFLWILYLFSGIFIILLKMGLTRNIRITFPVKLWLPWFGYSLLSLAWVDDLTLRNVQDALMITSPLIIGIAASLFFQNEEQLRSLRYAFICCLIIIIGIFLCDKCGIFEIFKLSIFKRAMALTITIIGCVIISGLSVNLLSSVFGWIGCLAITVLTGSRMATLILLLLIIVHPSYNRISSKVAAFLIIISLSIGLFYTSIFQKRFFDSETGNLEQVIRGEFLSMGRFETWPLIFNEAKKNIFIGVGIGEAFNFIPTIWPSESHEVNHVHNDYLRILYEGGLIGLFCFLSVILFQLKDLVMKIRFIHHEQRRVFIAAYCGIVALLVSALTDNTIVYNLWYMNPLFLLIGAAYGVMAHDQAGYAHTSNA